MLKEAEGEVSLLEDFMHANHMSDEEYISSATMKGTFHFKYSPYSEKLMMMQVDMLWKVIVQSKSPDGPTCTYTVLSSSSGVGKRSFYVKYKEIGFP